MFALKIILLSFLLTNLVLSVKVPKDASDVGLHTIEMVEKHGYPAETHYVTTEDGYIVTLHRIPNGKNSFSASQKPIAYLMHGLISSSSDYVNMGPEISLGYMLADAGYDVWLANARGNAYSRNHTTLDVIEDAEQFFDFSWHEMGYYDVPASIDYILETTQEESFFYIGHSQGCATFAVFAATRPEYSSKIKLASLMAPAVFMEHRPFSFTFELCKYYEQVETLLNKYKIYEMPYLDEIREWAMTTCVDPENYDLCVSVFSALAGDLDESQTDKEMIAVIGTNAPSNIAMKQALHFCQSMRNGGFSFYDYGAAKNEELYGSDTAPAYDLKQITAPVAIYYAESDKAVDQQDAVNLVKELPNVVKDYLVPYEPYNHLDFVFAKDNKKLIYNDLLAEMEKYK